MLFYKSIQNSSESEVMKHIQVSKRMFSSNLSIIHDKIALQQCLFSAIILKIIEKTLNKDISYQ